MLPTIALVGRPNVGKSTLFNCLTRSRDALVADIAGLTRDRQYGEGQHEDQAFIVVDTGGIEIFQRQGIVSEIVEQTQKAIEEADIILWLVDARDGLTAMDQDIADNLKGVRNKLHLVINKIDGLDADTAAADFYSLGISQVHCIAAAHRRGVNTLIESVLGTLPIINQPIEVSELEENGIKIAIVGRPNVGKSTLVNRLLGEERVVVYDQPGTTRDSIYINYQHHGKDYCLIDTAGVRRRKNIKETIEKFSIVKTLQSINDANVVVLLLDAQEGLVDQDLHLLGFVLSAGRGIVLAINKWDGLSEYKKNTIKREIDRRLVFAQYIKSYFISALHGTGVGHLYEGINVAFNAANKKVSTKELNNLLHHITMKHPPPLVRGRRIKLRYAHQGGSNPPLFIIHGKQTDQLLDSYKRYLENAFRQALKLYGTPVHFEFKVDANPYAGRRNELSRRQELRRKRLMKHVKKTKK